MALHSSLPIKDLRDHLFMTIESLRDEDKPMEIDRAATIAHVAQVIVNSAKIENDRLKLTGGKSASDFITEGAPELPKPGQPRLIKGA